MDKYLNWIMLALLGVLVWMIYNTNKAIATQSALLIGIAKKTGLLDDIKAPASKESQAAEDEEEQEEEIEKEISAVATKIYSGEKLSKKEKDFYGRHQSEVNEYTVSILLKNDLSEISAKIADKKELSQAEADFYNDSFEKYKEEFSLTPLTSEIAIKKDTTSAANSTNVSKPSQKEPRRSIEEKIHIVLSLFDTGKPLFTDEITKLYAEKTGTKPSGNTYKVLDKLIETRKLKNESFMIGHPKRKKVYWGLASWFDGNKFSKEYSVKIPKA